MSKHSDIRAELKESMLARDTLRTSVIRGLLASFTNELIAKGSNASELPDDDVLALIRRAVKQRKDSIAQYTAGGRKDLADVEKSELALLERYLPLMMSHDEIRKFVENKISGAGSGGTVDKAKIGQFIGSIMKDLKGKADGADVKAVVEEVVKS